MLRTVLALLAMMAAASAWGETRRIAHEQTLHVTAEAGQVRHVFTYASFHRDCRPRPAPQIVLRQAPQHGVVSMRPAISTITVLREGAPDCSGYDIPGTELLYTAAPGFHGTEQFDYDVISDNGQSGHDTAVVTVR